nr:hypothetical protein [Tanacetum cinerariifolium]
MMSEKIRLGSQPDNPLVNHGRELLERLTGADMRNAMQMIGARHELQRSMAEKSGELLAGIHGLGQGKSHGLWCDLRTIEVFYLALSV